MFFFVAMVAVMIKRVMIRAGEGRIIGDGIVTVVEWPQLMISVASNSKPNICINHHANPVLVEDDMSPDQTRRLIKLPESMVSDRYHCSCVACR